MMRLPLLTRAMKAEKRHDEASIDKKLPKAANRKRRS
jgi:hypothetical protein